MVSRIIAGSLASRRIATPSGSRTRPTTDQVRESVFALMASWYDTAGTTPAGQLGGVKFLDLYAGSGAVGLEAFSRGADVTWVDRQTTIIKQNLAALQVCGSVLTIDVERFLRRKPVGFDIVWMDPPYETPTTEINCIIANLSSNGWVKDRGYIMVERCVHTSAVEFPESFLVSQPRRYGDTIIHYGEKVRV